MIEFDGEISPEKRNDIGEDEGFRGAGKVFFTRRIRYSSLSLS